MDHSGKDQRCRQEGLRFYTPEGKHGLTFDWSAGHGNTQPAVGLPIRSTAKAGKSCEHANSSSSPPDLSWQQEASPEPSNQQDQISSSYTWEERSKYLQLDRWKRLHKKTKQRPSS
ncbi:MAG: hypothetical protein M1812_006790 [Candelaria pacifica]|nr:MAG: hypothetical protein M1812_006790 [Candelaria pacifica]